MQFKFCHWSVEWKLVRQNINLKGRFEWLKGEGHKQYRVPDDLRNTFFIIFDPINHPNILNINQEKYERKNNKGS